MPNPKTSEPDLVGRLREAVSPFRMIAQMAGEEASPFKSEMVALKHVWAARDLLTEAAEALLAAEAERDRLRGALLGRIREENDCRPDLERRPDCNGWDAEKCGCALEARLALSDTLGGEKGSPSLQSVDGDPIPANPTSEGR